MGFDLKIVDVMEEPIRTLERGEINRAIANTWDWCCGDKELFKETLQCLGIIPTEKRIDEKSI